LDQTQLADLAAMGSLGLLEGDDLRQFEELVSSGDASALAARRDVEEIAAMVALAVEPALPGSGLKGRLMERANEILYEGLGALRASEGVWTPTNVAGVTCKRLYYDRDTKMGTLLVRMAPGACYPAHRHSRDEQCLILEGDLTYPNGKSYGPGDFTWAKAGSIDPELHTVGGNLLLIIASRDDKAYSANAGYAS
jgi:hypothetical protein